MVDVGELAIAAGAYRQQHGHWPAHEALRRSHPGLPALDRWRRPFRYDLAGDTLTIRTAGLDGRFDTTDDIQSGLVRPTGW